MPERRPPRKGDPLSMFVERRRRELGLDQVQLGVKLGAEGRGPVNRLENGYLPLSISAEWIRDWARALEVTPEELVVEGHLHRYLAIPAQPADLSPGRQLLLAAVAGLTEEQIRQIARALSALVAAFVAQEPPDQS